MGYFVELPKRYHPDFRVPNRQPTGPVEVDFSTAPKGLIRYWIGGQLVPLLGPPVAQGNSTADVEAKVFRGAKSLTTVDYGSLAESDSTPVSGAQDRTFIAVINHTSSNAGFIFTLGGGGIGSDGQRWSVRVDGSTGLRIEIQGSGYTSSLPANNGRHFVACRLDGTKLAGHTLFVDGQKEQATGGSSVNTNASNNIRLLGQDTGSTTKNAVDAIEWAAFFDRALTEAEIEAVRQDYYGRLLKPVGRYGYFAAAAGGGSTTPQSVSGSMTMSGTLSTVFAANQSVSGSTTPTGDLTKLIQATLVGSSSPQGTVVKAVSKLLSGSVTLTGANQRRIEKVLSGSMTPTGTVATTFAALVSLAGSTLLSGLVNTVFLPGIGLVGNVVDYIRGAIKSLIKPIVTQNPEKSKNARSKRKQPN